MIVVLAEYLPTINDCLSTRMKWSFANIIPSSYVTRNPVFATTVAVPVTTLAVAAAGEIVLDTNFSALKNVLVLLLEPADVYLMYNVFVSGSDASAPVKLSITWAVTPEVWPVNVDPLKTETSTDAPAESLSLNLTYEISDS